ncbi:MAG: hypothetical protein Q8Q02_17225, partial [Nocardioides sp.]|nr:hypothetical protein [Nocardioides sp.]
AVQVLDPLGGGSGSVESTGDTAVTADQPSSARAEDGAEGEAEGFAADAPESLDDAPAGAGLPSLTTRSFALDVAALPSEPADPARPPASCTPGGLSLETDVRAVLLDARPGVLALLPAGTDGAGPGSRVAEAWQCGDLTGPAGTAAPPRVRVIIAAG